ncbi:hypothetical protein SK128_000671, partial [Halocaridina rubra]
QGYWISRETEVLQENEVLQAWLEKARGSLESFPLRILKKIPGIGDGIPEIQQEQDLLKTSIFGYNKFQKACALYGANFNQYEQMIDFKKTWYKLFVNLPQATIKTPEAFTHTSVSQAALYHLVCSVLLGAAISLTTMIASRGMKYLKQTYKEFKDGLEKLEGPAQELARKCKEESEISKSQETEAFEECEDDVSDEYSTCEDQEESAGTEIFEECEGEIKAAVFEKVENQTQVDDRQCNKENEKNKVQSSDNPTPWWWPLLVVHCNGGGKYVKMSQVLKE